MEYNFGGNQYGGFATNSRTEEVAAILKEVEDLHNLPENEWSFRTYKKLYGAPACRGSYNNTHQRMRVKISVKAPLQKTMAYFLYPPYGYRESINGRSSGVDITEELGKGAVVAYSEGPDQTFCCCHIAARDIVCLQALKFVTSTEAVFASKTIDHPSHPQKEGVYRIQLPMAGTYFKQEGDETHVEAYVSEMDMGGKIGKVIPSKMMDSLVRQMIGIAAKLPNAEDQPPPYLQAVASGQL